MAAMRATRGRVGRRSRPGAPRIAVALLLQFLLASSVARAESTTNAAAASGMTPASAPGPKRGPVPVPAAGREAGKVGVDALATLQLDVEAAERGFARSMADRDLAAFDRFLADESVFFQGPQRVLRGRAAVLEVWKRYFEAPVAPFSWEPDEVEVLASGTLAATSGPVRNPAGQVIGRFHSIWRHDGDGHWRIVFDRGESPCDCRDAVAPQ